MATYTEIKSIFYQRTGWNDVVGSKCNKTGIYAQQIINADVFDYNQKLKNFASSLNNRPNQYKSRKSDLLANLSEVSL